MFSSGMRSEAETVTCETRFGSFKGGKGDGVVTFRGVKYASLRDQLSSPELVSEYGGEVVDAIEFGYVQLILLPFSLSTMTQHHICILRILTTLNDRPRAPAMDGCALEQSTLIQCEIDASPEVQMSGTECLNLNITVPACLPGPGSTPRLLPVMVFIHGGGYIMGGNHWPQYDPCRFVKLSAEMGMPIIAVNFNYRLGVLGNLTSEELRRAGYPGNNSLRDQRCALKWVKECIAGFGGDQENVTVFGESAGAGKSFPTLQLSRQDILYKSWLTRT